MKFYRTCTSSLITLTVSTFYSEWFYFCSTKWNSVLFSLPLKSSEGEFRVFASILVPSERNSELFSLPLIGSERNSESFNLFLFNGTEFRVVFSSAEGFGTEFRELSVPRNSRNSVGNNHLFRLFRLPRNYFFVGNSQPYL
jgi:hypothetical protein